MDSKEQQQQDADYHLALQMHYGDDDDEDHDLEEHVNATAGVVVPPSSLRSSSSYPVTSSASATVSFDPQEVSSITYYDPVNYRPTTYAAAMASGLISDDDGFTDDDRFTDDDNDDNEGGLLTEEEREDSNNNKLLTDYGEDGGGKMPAQPKPPSDVPSRRDNITTNGSNSDVVKPSNNSSGNNHRIKIITGRSNRSRILGEGDKVDEEEEQEARNKNNNMASVRPSMTARGGRKSRNNNTLMTTTTTTNNNNNNKRNDPRMMTGEQRTLKFVPWYDITRKDDGDIVFQDWLGTYGMKDTKRRILIHLPKDMGEEEEEEALVDDSHNNRDNGGTSSSSLWSSDPTKMAELASYDAKKHLDTFYADPKPKYKHIVVPSSSSSVSTTQQQQQQGRWRGGHRRRHKFTSVVYFSDVDDDDDEDDDDEIASGEGWSLEESQQMAARNAVNQILNPSSDPDEEIDTAVMVSSSQKNIKNDNDHNNLVIAKRAQELTISFRGAATYLPFSVRFQLERAIFDASQPQHPQLRVRKRPLRLVDRKEDKLKSTFFGRRLVLTFLLEILPPLLRIPDFQQQGGTSSNSTDAGWIVVDDTSKSSSGGNGREDFQEDRNCSTVTLSELFALEIWKSLLDAKAAIATGKSCQFFAGEVDAAMIRARRQLKLAEQRHKVTEKALLTLSNGAEVGISSCLELVKKRSVWPIAEYRCKFDANGVLVPTDYEVVNSYLDGSIHATAPTTRRAIREAGWLVRDRFMLVSGVQIHELHIEKLVPWLKTKPQLCNRTYEYLFDKGTGKPNLWLYSSSPNMSRSQLLQTLGCFDGITPTKLGDRISLAFTLTKPVVEFRKEDILPILEIAHNGYIFSDGCGVMGKNVAKAIQKEFGMSELPGAAQIRMGGVKGMISLNVNFDDDKIGIRPSMVKFRSSHTILEVKRVAKTNDRPDNKLFSQILLIMHSRGIIEDAFTDLLAKACAEMAFAYDRDAKCRKAIEAGDAGKAKDYINKNVLKGRKENDEPFSTDELVDLNRVMSEARTRVNLRCSIVLMLGVIDEHQFLKKGQVLVGNGAIQGNVLICRSPCNTLGDIQMAYAVSRDEKGRFDHLRHSLVFSSLDDRPLPDKLAGGDLDGDEYYIVDESRLFSLSPVEAYDFGSRKEHNVPESINVDECFSVPHGASAPELSKQLDVFQQFLALGNIVPLSAEAWLKVADAKGPGDELSKRMAGLCQRALDARKLAFKDTKEERAEMNKVLDKFHTPHHWRGGSGLDKRGHKIRRSDSILGKLHDQWDEWIHTLKARGRPDDDVAATDVRPLVSNSLLTPMACIVCEKPGAFECSLCGGAWLCSFECDEKHTHRSCQPSRSSETTIRNRNVGDQRGGYETLAKSAMDRLMDVVFQRESPTFDKDKKIDFRRLCNNDIETMVNMVLVEFSQALNQGIMEARDDVRDTPRAQDVFLLNRRIGLEGLVVCRRQNRSGGGLEFVDGNNSRLDPEDVQYCCRVGSLSGPCRILESLLAEKRESTLSYWAMRRERLVDVVEASEVKVASELSFLKSLNTSQLQVVGTIMDPNFESGFLAIQGPPGTGKTSTILGIVASVGRGVVLTAPSNAAVANMALRLLSTLHFTIDDLVVWGENCDEAVLFLNPTYRNYRWDRFKVDYDDTIDNDDKQKKLRDFAAFLHLDQEATLENVCRLCQLGREDGDLKVVARAKVIVCTLNSAGSTKLRKAAGQNFNLLILDEAAQCPEAEVYIACTFPGVRRVIVVGDPHQLPTTVVNPDCRSSGYGESFLAHILEFLPTKVHLLQTQYRMDPCILRFSNECVYSNRVISGANVFNREPHIESPFHMVDTQGVGREEQVRLSWKNDFEAAIVKDIIQNDKDIRLLQEASEGPIRALVISPYRAQVDVIKKMLKKTKSQITWEVASVDAFQGQEGDIVILSLVRTRSTGFTDDPNRINVALTRAKRILRVVGGAHFFKSQFSPGSFLKKLAHFAEKHKIIRVSNCPADWTPPDWNITTSWRPTMTSKFHHCLGAMGQVHHRNIAFNTLLAVATPDLKKLRDRPNETEEPKWQMSTLKSSDIRLVWAAKQYDWNGGPPEAKHYVGDVEAHFAGKRDECLRFIQRNQQLPKLARSPKRDMTGILPHEETIATHSTEVQLSWLVENGIQGAVVNDEISDDLPEGLIVLDPDQERIIACTPPLLIESRSGTGKTNVLFQHALSYYTNGEPIHSSFNGAKPSCFVTVSSRLRDELERRYKEIGQMNNITLPKVHFFVFRTLLDLFLQLTGVKDMKMSSVCSFVQYVHSRTSHEKLPVESSLIENEIGGVIVGSLSAAIKKSHLSLDEYLAEKRSNVRNNDDDGRTKRRLIYAEFDKYRKWKQRESKYDIGDVVLRLLNLEFSEEAFHSVYLDEVQDFSYAAIFLVCSMAGKANMQWIAAGDTAQMISPGCSFKFDGMKETLLHIRKDTELRKVEQLKRNYRMTKGVLDVANAILRILKSHFPNVIESAIPEIAMKDLGMRVVLLDWKKALSWKKAVFGVDQALIYSGSGEPPKNEIGWLNNHPFILSALDSKGLEFDDVMVAFDAGRKVWKIEADNVDSLRLLRELYVAITRAKRRVVILFQKGPMLDFFKNMELEILEPSEIMVEFETKVTDEEWFQRAKKLFEDKNFKLASLSFNAAKQYGWSGWAQGRHLISLGSAPDAKNVYRNAAQIFFNASDYERCLDVMVDVSELKPWEPEDDKMLDKALEKLPNYLPRRSTARFAVERGAWSTISLDDLKNKGIATIFLDHRDAPRLKEIIATCLDDDRKTIEQTLPALVGDYYFGRGMYTDAARLFIHGNDCKAAAMATEHIIGQVNDDSFALDEIDHIAKLWNTSVDRKAVDDIAGSKIHKKLALLLSLFQDPDATAIRYASECMRTLGPKVVKLAVQGAGLGDERLYQFSRNDFEVEVEMSLKNKYPSMPIDIVRWYFDNKDTTHAKQFAASHLQEFNDDQLLDDILKCMRLRPSGLLDEIAHRGLYVQAATACLTADRVEKSEIQFAGAISDRGLQSIELAAIHAEGLLRMWRAHGTGKRVRSERAGLRPQTSCSTLLCLLFDNPQEAGERHAELCISTFGPAIVRMAVTAKSPYGNVGVAVVLDSFGLDFYKVGDRVALDGLQARNRNGQRGTISTGPSGMHYENGRYCVKLDGGKKSLSVKVVNLVKLEEDVDGIVELEDDDASESSESAAGLPPLAARHQGSDASTSSDDEGDGDSDVPCLDERPRSLPARRRNNPPSQERDASTSSGDGDSDSDSSGMPSLDSRGGENSSSEDET